MSIHSVPVVPYTYFILYACVCVEMIDCGESDKMIKMSRKMDKSNHH